jgi:hypothetical protein
MMLPPVAVRPAADDRDVVGVFLDLPALPDVLGQDGQVGGQDRVLGHSVSMTSVCRSARDGGHAGVGQVRSVADPT